jgi:hypothetical protein
MGASCVTFDSRYPISRIVDIGRTYLIVYTKLYRVRALYESEISKYHTSDSSSI